MSPTRKPSKKRAARWSESEVAIRAKIGREIAELDAVERPISRAFLIRLAAVTCSIIVSDKQGLGEYTYLDRFTDLIEKAVRDQ